MSCEVEFVSYKTGNKKNITIEVVCNGGRVRDYELTFSPTTLRMTLFKFNNIIREKLPRGTSYYPIFTTVQVNKSYYISADDYTKILNYIDDSLTNAEKEALEKSLRYS